MPKVTDITVLNIDEVPYAVDLLPEEVQGLVEIYNDWNRKEADVRDELTRFQAAKETLSHQIITKVRNHIAETTKEEVEVTSTEEPEVGEETGDAPDNTPVAK